jgi:hypothetical protein
LLQSFAYAEMHPWPSLTYMRSAMSFAGTARSETFICLVPPRHAHIFLRRFLKDWMYVPALYISKTDQSSRAKVRPEENDGAKLSTAMSRLEDSSAIVQLLGTLEGP